MNKHNKPPINFKKINLFVISVFALLIIIPTVIATITYTPADWTRTFCTYNSGAGSNVNDSGNVAGDSASISIAGACAEEGTIICDTQSSDTTAGTTTTPTGPINTENINWDGDVGDCDCYIGSGRWALGGEVAQTSCCGDDTGENYAGPNNGKSCDGTTACCDSASDSVRNGVCVSACYFWENLFGNPITGADNGDTVRMTVSKPGMVEGTDILFEINEGSDAIRTGADAIMGTSVNETAVAYWTIIQADLDKTSSLNNFQFTTDFSSDISDDLEILVGYNNTISTLDIISPSCGSYFDASPSTFDITINAFDEDDLIDGTLTLDETQIATFGNGGITVGYNFSEGGEYKLIAETTNTRGKKTRKISNIMVIDTTVDGGYVAACITTPEDYSDIPTSYVEFDSSTSLGVRHNATSGISTELSLSNLTFDWTFSDGRTNPYTLGSDELSYRFFKNFYTVGSNWAKLQVSII